MSINIAIATIAGTLVAAPCPPSHHVHHTHHHVAHHATSINPKPIKLKTNRPHHPAKRKPHSTHTVCFSLLDLPNIPDSFEALLGPPPGPPGVPVTGPADSTPTLAPLEFATQAAPTPLTGGFDDGGGPLPIPGGGPLPIPGGGVGGGPGGGSPGGGGVPEPSTWALALIGFGLVGASLRAQAARRRSASA